MEENKNTLTPEQDEILNNCNYSDAKNEILYVIEVGKQSAEMKGNQFVMADFFFEAFDEFFNNPCKDTATALLQIAPNLWAYFEKCSTPQTDNFQGIIGKQIPFKEIKNTNLWYKDHVMFSCVENGEVVAPPIPNPYAIITVQMQSKENAILLVAHKIDFTHLYRLEQEGYLKDEKYLVYIKYMPAAGLRKIFSPFLPKLEYNVMEFDKHNNLRNIIKAYDQEWRLL